MFPQTHVYFAGEVLGKINDAIIMGSIFPDMAIGAGLHRDISHGSGQKMLEFFGGQRGEMYDFALGNFTHGTEPQGLDYFGDEKNPPFERGYCFEKGRLFIDATIDACNIVPEMGWWKAHNIVEMGIELRIGAEGPYGELLYQAFQNQQLIDHICRNAGEFYSKEFMPFIKRIKSFPDYIAIKKTTAQYLAEKYDYQMYYKHKVHIDIKKVSRLINMASESVEDDLDHFFEQVISNVKSNLSLEKKY